MSSIIPANITINGQKHSVFGWAGKLEFKEWGGPIRYTAVPPYAVLHPNLYFVYDANGSKIGEFNTDNGTCSGCVTNFEMPEKNNQSGGNVPERRAGTEGGDLGWLVGLLFMLVGWAIRIYFKLLFRYPVPVLIATFAAVIAAVIAHYFH